MGYYIGSREQNNVDIAFIKGFYSSVEEAKADIEKDKELGLMSKFPDDAEVIYDGDESDDY